MWDMVMEIMMIMTRRRKCTYEENEHRNPHTEVLIEDGGLEMGN